MHAVAATGSTNADVAAMAAAGAPDGTVLVTEEQLAGKGRSGRTWTSPAGAGLLCSILLRPGVPAERRGWVGALVGLAVVDAIAASAGVAATLKWPNDVLVGDRKCAGILGEVAADAVIVGIGLNVSLQADELPRPDATSLQLEAGGPVDRENLLAALLDRLDPLVERWRAAGGDADASGVRAAYRAACSTLGARVRLDLPGRAPVTGTAEDVDEFGRLLLRDDQGRTEAYSAGDVEHLRRAG